MFFRGKKKTLMLRRKMKSQNLKKKETCEHDLDSPVSTSNKIVFYISRKMIKRVQRALKFWVLDLTLIVLQLPNWMVAHLQRVPKLIQSRQKYCQTVWLHLQVLEWKYQKIGITFFKCAESLETYFVHKIKSLRRVL